MQIMDDMGVYPVFHCYVYEWELKAINRTAVKLVEEHKIGVISYEEILKSEIDKIAYDMAFEELYQRLNAESIPNTYKTFQTFVIHKKNLGEIHSTILASFLKLKYFMSDDRKAKAVLLQKVNSEEYTLTILNVPEFFEKYARIPNKSIKRKQIKDLIKWYFLEKDLKNRYEKMIKNY